MEVYITVYRHREGTIYVQLNKTEEGQQRFIENLNTNIFYIECIGCEKVDD